MSKGRITQLEHYALDSTCGLLQQSMRALGNLELKLNEYDKQREQHE